MHEKSMMENLIKSIEKIAEENPDREVVGVTVKIGKMCSISPDYFQEHYDYAAQGTPAEGAKVNLEIIANTQDPRATELWLDSVELK